MLLVEFIDNQEARRPPQRVTIGGKRGKIALAEEKIASRRTQSPCPFQPLSLPAHSNPLCWGCPYLRSLLRQVFADTQVHRCRGMCQWGSCTPFVFQHSRLFPLHTHPHLERMYKFIKGAALIPCSLNIRQHQVTNFYWHYFNINLLPFAFLGAGLLRWEGIF